MNVRVGELRPLQLLDAQGREFHTDDWSVDDTNLAEITEEDGRVVLYPKAPGVVNVAASLDGTTQTRKITIWRQQFIDWFFSNQHQAIKVNERACDVAIFIGL